MMFLIKVSADSCLSAVQSEAAGLTQDQDEMTEAGFIQKIASEFTCHSV